MNHKIIKSLMRKMAGTPWPISFKDCGKNTQNSIKTVIEYLNIDTQAALQIYDTGNVHISTKTFSLESQDFALLAKITNEISYHDGMIEFTLKDKNISH